MNTKPVTINYVTGPCSRCGGSGKHSYCQMYGDTCFQCNGKGRTLTAKAAKSKLLIDARIKELCSVPVESIVAGDRVRGITGIKNNAKVLSVGPSGSSFGTRNADGSNTWTHYIALEFRGITQNIHPGTLVIKMPNPEQQAEIADYARTLPDVRI